MPVQTPTNEERLKWLEQQAKKSRTGISFDWVPSVEGEPSGYRFMRRGWIGPPFKSITQAIDDAMGEERKQQW